MRRVNLKLGQGLHTRLRILSFRRGESLQAMLERWIEERLANEERQPQEGDQ